MALVKLLYKLLVHYCMKNTAVNESTDFTLNEWASVASSEMDFGIGGIPYCTTAFIKQQLLKVDRALILKSFVRNRDYFKAHSVLCVM